MRQTILDHVTFGLFTAALPDILGSVEIGMRFPSAQATPKLSRNLVTLTYALFGVTS
jgi:hypothetical protein